MRAEGTRNVGWTDNETGTKYMRLVVGSGSSAGGRQEGHSQEAFEHEESMGSESRAGHEDQRGHRDSREESSCASPAVRKSCLRPRVPCRPGLLRRGGAKSLPCDYVGAKSPGESFKVALGGGGGSWMFHSSWSEQAERRVWGSRRLAEGTADSYWLHRLSLCLCYLIITIGSLECRYLSVE